MEYVLRKIGVERNIGLKSNFFGDYWYNYFKLYTYFKMLILSFEKTNEKCGDNLHGEAFVRIYFEEYKKY